LGGFLGGFLGENGHDARIRSDGARDFNIEVAAGTFYRGAAQLVGEIVDRGGGHTSFTHCASART
jgi:hypothetical protein